MSENQNVSLKHYHLAIYSFYLLLMYYSYLAEQQLPSLPIPGVTEFRILVGHSLHHKSL